MEIGEEEKEEERTQMSCLIGNRKIIGESTRQAEREKR